ncbi:MAG: hypothetical protein WCJ73_00075, partial [Actinomycetes bacterium]
MNMPICALPHGQQHPPRCLTGTHGFCKVCAGVSGLGDLDLISPSLRVTNQRENKSPKLKGLGMSVLEEVLSANETYAAGFGEKSQLSL